MRSGIIKAEAAERVCDRRDHVLPLWERGAPEPVEWPWSDVSGLTASEIASMLSGAPTAVLVVGTTPSSRVLLDASLAAVEKGTRLYVYGDGALEPESGLLQVLAGRRDRVLARLGPRPPADWLVADHGRIGQLLVGPHAGVRRWSLSVEDERAQALFQAFRALFWFHSTREALPDAVGKVVWRAPIAAPFPDPGPRLRLAAGWLGVGESLDPIVDAEVRISPMPLDPGRAATVFVPPLEGAGRPADLSLPQVLSQRGSHVCWLDLGLPRMTVTRERMQIELVEGPIRLQLEWPRRAAVDMIHRLERASRRAEWTFHPQRRIGEIVGEVLLSGATRPELITPRIKTPLPDVVAPLLDFDRPAPRSFPEPPPLTLAVTYHWRRVPPTLPPGARTAELVQRWKVVDEWAARTVQQLRGALEQLDKQEGFLARLRRWLPARDSITRERRRLADDVDLLGEVRPSDDAAGAAERCAKLEAIAERIRELTGGAHDERQKAEDAAADEAQRAAWEMRRNNALAALEKVRARLSETERELGEAQERLTAAEAVLRGELEARRAARAAGLEDRHAELAHDLEQVREEQVRLKQQHNGNPPKELRRPLQQRVEKLQQELAGNRRETANLANWRPEQGALSPFEEAIQRAREAVQQIARRQLSAHDEARGHESAAAEDYRFQPPPRLASPQLVSVAQRPAAPNEAPPELGELFEHQNRRFLAVASWEQVKLAAPVAQRLRAELVAQPPPRK